jgi:signal transduction histidine kinase
MLHHGCLSQPPACRGPSATGNPPAAARAAGSAVVGTGGESPDHGGQGPGDQARGEGTGGAREAIAARVGPAGASPSDRDRDSAGSAFHVEHERQLATLGSLVASIAHEINNILTPIASYADLARMHPDDEELTAKALQRAAAGARQASEIATAILSLATPDRGVAPSHCDDLRDIIHRSTLCLGSEPAARGVRVNWEAPQGLALAMPGVALQQVLVNLLINALRASKRGGVIEVAAAGDGGRRTGGGGGAGSTWNFAEVIGAGRGRRHPRGEAGRHLPRLRVRLRLDGPRPRHLPPAAGEVGGLDPAGGDGAGGDGLRGHGRRWRWRAQQTAA